MVHVRRTLPGGWFLVLTGTACIISFIVWAYFSEIDHVVRAQGQIIAAARTQIIQSAEAGTLKSLFVQEGEQVKQGQLLALLDQERVLAGYQDSMNKVAALRATLARLRAEVFGSKLVFPPELDEWSVFRNSQLEFYERRRRALTEGIEALEKTRKLIVQELEVTSPLVKLGDVGQIEELRLKRQLADVEGQIVNLKNKFFEDAQAEMVRAEEELAAQEQLLNERTVLLESTELRAPVDGVVRKIEITTLGAAIRPGDVIMELLPTGSELIVEAEFLPVDVGALKVGLPADVKLDAYDYSIYGSVKGEVVYISPDALTENDPRTGVKVYYRVRVQIDKTSIAGKEIDKQIVITPGMPVTVEVRAKERPILTYLTKPITKTFSESLGER